MGFINSLKSLFLIDEEDDDYYEDSIEEKETIYHRPNENTQILKEKADRPAPISRNSYFSQTSASDFKMIVIEPKDFNECTKLVDSLKKKRSVIVNLENLPTELASKIFNFLNGATYALDGKVQKVTNNIFVFVPDKVEISTGRVGNIKTRVEEDRSDGLML